MLPQHHYGGGKTNGRFKLLPLAFLFYVALGQLGTAAQLLGTSSNTTLVLSSQGLAVALTNPIVTKIIFNGKVKILEADFRPTPTLARNLTFAGIDGGPEPPNLNFDFTIGVLLVGENIGLEFHNMSLTDAARQQSGSTDSKNAIVALSLWPSISGAPGSSFLFRSTNTYYTVPNNYNNCTGYQAKTVLRLKQQPNGSSITQPDASTISIPGIQTAQLAVTSARKDVGFANYASSNTTMTCTGKFKKQGGSVRFPWWAGVLIGLGVAAVLCVTAFLLSATYIRNKRRQLSETYSADVESTAKASLMATPMSAPGGWTPPGSGQHSVTGELGGGSNSSGLIATQRARTMSATGVRSETLEDIHSQLLGMRMQHGLDGVEVGPLLGRGSYGSVFKGRWRGTLVAIKVVEAGFSEAGDDGSRESLLSASIAHPNVVACFKICLVRAREAAASDSGPLQAYRSQSVADADINSAISDACCPRGTATRADSLPATASGTGSGAVSIRALARAETRSESLPAAARGGTRSGPSSALARAGSWALPGGGQPRGTPRGTDGSGTPNGLVLEVLGSESEAGTANKQGQLQTWMLLEYCDRGSLDQAIQMRRFYKRSTQTLDVVSIYRTLVDVAAGVEHLHALGIVHADLKPGNVLLKSTATDARGFICKLADFGLSRMVTDSCTHVSAATTGTVPYMPPEMLLHQRMTKSTDVYSFGVIMNQLFTGETPFAGMTMPAVLMGVVHEGQRPDTTDNQPPEYAALRDRCWDSNPDKRPSFEVIMHELLAQSKALTAPKSVSKDEQPVSSFAQHKQKLQQHQQQQQELPAIAALPVPEAIKAAGVATVADVLRGSPSGEKSMKGKAPHIAQQPLETLADSASSQLGSHKVAVSPFASLKMPLGPAIMPNALLGGGAQALGQANHSNVGPSPSPFAADPTTRDCSTAGNFARSPSAMSAAQSPSGESHPCSGVPMESTGQTLPVKGVSDGKGEVLEGSVVGTNPSRASPAVRPTLRIHRSSSFTRTPAQEMEVLSMRRASTVCSSNSEGSLNWVATRGILPSRAPVAARKESGSEFTDKFRPLMQKGTSEHGTIRYSLDMGGRPSSVRSHSMQLADGRGAQLLNNFRERFVPLGSTAEGKPDAGGHSRLGTSASPATEPTGTTPSDASSRLAANSSRPG